MKPSKFWTFLKAVNQAWPRPAIVFLVLSFVATAWWLYDSVRDPDDWRELGWLEPMAAILGGIGAFLLAVILIFRRVDSAKAEADTYGLARGLATGYYFNFVRPLIAALQNPTHPVHNQIVEVGGKSVGGLVVGIPQSLEEFDATRHDALLSDTLKARGDLFDIKELKVTVEGRPRPVFTKLAISRKTNTAILLDIPTTLAVIADFAEFVAKEEEASGAGDELVSDARARLVASSEAGQFSEVLEEFLDVVNKVSAMESRQMSPAALLHIVPLNRMARRLDELGDH